MQDIQEKSEKQSANTVAESSRSAFAEEAMSSMKSAASVGAKAVGEAAAQGSALGTAAKATEGVASGIAEAAKIGVGKAMDQDSATGKEGAIKDGAQQIGKKIGEAAAAGAANAVHGLDNKSNEHKSDNNEAKPTHPDAKEGMKDSCANPNILEGHAVEVGKRVGEGASKGGSIHEGSPNEIHQGLPASGGYDHNFPNPKDGNGGGGMKEGVREGAKQLNNIDKAIPGEVFKNSMNSVEHSSHSKDSSDKNISDSVSKALKGLPNLHIEKE